MASRRLATERNNLLNKELNSPFPSWAWKPPPSLHRLSPRPCEVTWMSCAGERKERPITQEGLISSLSPGMAFWGLHCRGHPIRGSTTQTLKPHRAGFPSQRCLRHHNASEPFLLNGITPVSPRSTALLTQ